MASRTPLLPDDKQQDSLYNPGEQISKEKLEGSPTVADWDQMDAFRSDPKNIADAQKTIADNERKGSVPDADWRVRSDYSGWKTEKSKGITLNNVRAVIKKRGGIIGVIALLGIGGLGATTLFSPFGMLVGIMQQATQRNDTVGSSFEQRFFSVFGHATKNPGLCNLSKKISCGVMGRLSNRTLGYLAKKGVGVTFADGSSYDGKRFGYPTAGNPTTYHIQLKGDARPRNISADQLRGFLAANPEAARSILGPGGAINVRTKAWLGKYITKKLFKPFGLKRNGGIADGTNKPMSATERRAQAHERVNERLRGVDGINTVADSVSSKVNSHLGKAKKAGAAYIISVAACIGVKAPGYIAAGVAGIQTLQALPISFDTILSPAGKVVGSAIGSGFTSEDMATSMALLTEKYPDENGVMRSAVESDIFQSAIGVNTGRPAVEPDLTPGYGVIKDPALQAVYQADKAMEPVCNVIMSPAAMYTALAVSSAVTVAASATIVGGLIKVAADLVIGEVATQTASHVAGDVARTTLTNVAKSNLIPQARGAAFGDVLGISILGFFSGGGMSRHLPVLTQSQLRGFGQIQDEYIERERQYALETLSPFDTSSQYTFLGSIVSSLRNSLLSSGNYNGSFSSIFSGLMQMSSLAFQPPVQAASLFETSCSYAEEFGLSTGDPNTTPAINVAGYPCTGLSDTQSRINTEQAINLVSEWIDESIPFDDDATIDELVAIGVFKEDTPLTDYIESCSDISSGDYIFNAASCTFATSGEVTYTEADLNNQGYTVCDDEEKTSCVTTGSVTTAPNALEAIPVFLADFQVAQIMNGNEEPQSQIDAGGGEDTETSYDTASEDVIAAINTYKNEILNKTILKKEPACFSRGASMLRDCVDRVSRFQFRALGVA